MKKINKKEGEKFDDSSKDLFYYIGVVVGVAAAGCRGGGWHKRVTRARHCPCTLLPRSGGRHCAVADKQ